MTDFNLGRAARRVRVTAPASVLNDFEQFQKALQGVLGQTGCPRCTSGIDFIWQEFEDFAISAEGEIRPVTPIAGPRPEPFISVSGAE
jgi:hypothetical protein